MTDIDKVLTGLECMINNEEPCEECPYNGSGYCLRNVSKDARELIQYQHEHIEAFMKDQEKIVLCKDCKYWKNKYMEYDVHPWLPCMEINTKGNWFCAEGEMG